MSKKQHKVKYGKKVIARTNIFLPLPFTPIPKGTPFYLNDAYSEGNAVVIGVKQHHDVAEVLFKVPKRIHSRMDVKEIISNLFIDYKEGFEYIFFEDGTYIEKCSYKAGDIIRL